MGECGGARRRTLLLFGLIAALLVAAGCASSSRNNDAGSQPRTAAKFDVQQTGETVIFVIDVSLSMEATDISPSRLTTAVARSAAFLESFAPSVEAGIVSFAGTAAQLLPPTSDRSAARSTLERLRLAQKTATGEGLFAGIDAFARAGKPGAVVLLSDGKQTVPRSLDDPRGAFTAAREAKAKGIPVHTISLGTPTGTVDVDGDAIPVPADDESLRRIAALSAGGTFQAAHSADGLGAAFDKVTKAMGLETAPRVRPS